MDDWRKKIDSLEFWNRNNSPWPYPCPRRQGLIITKRTLDSGHWFPEKKKSAFLAKNWNKLWNISDRIFEKDSKTCAEILHELKKKKSLATLVRILKKIRENFRDTLSLDSRRKSIDWYKKSYSYLLKESTSPKTCVLYFFFYSYKQNKKICLFQLTRISFCHIYCKYFG